MIHCSFPAGSFQFHLRLFLIEDTTFVFCTGHPYVHSGGSEMEALHEAYRQIDVVEDSDDYNHHCSSLEQRGRIHRSVSPSFPPHHVGQSLQPDSTNESGQTLHYCKWYLGESWGPYLCDRLIHQFNCRYSAPAKAVFQLKS